MAYTMQKPRRSWKRYIPGFEFILVLWPIIQARTSLNHYHYRYEQNIREYTALDVVLFTKWEFRFKIMQRDCDRY